MDNPAPSPVDYKQLLRSAVRDNRARKRRRVMEWAAILTTGGSLCALVGGSGSSASVPPPAAIARTHVVERSAAPVIAGPLPKRLRAATGLPSAFPNSDLIWRPAAPERRWRYIVLHHTASLAGDMASIDQSHQARTDGRGNHWRGIGYHFLIGNGHGMADGRIEPTFRWQEQASGAHAGTNEHNELGIGICLVGNFDRHSPTPAQLAAVKRLVSELKGRFEIGDANVLRHGQLKATACPGRCFPHAEIAAAAPAPAPAPAQAPAPAPAPAR